MDASNGPALVAVPLSHALNLVHTHHAVKESQTWADFERLMPPEFAKEAADMWREKHGTTEGPDAETAFEAPFAYDEGDWPGWLQQDMLKLLPANLRSRFGQVMTTTLSGDFLYIDPKHLDEVTSALEAAGYSCKQDEQLLLAAPDMLDDSSLGDPLKQ